MRQISDSVVDPYSVRILCRNLSEIKCEHHEYTHQVQTVADRGGVWGGSKPSEIPKFLQSRTGLQIERKMFSVPIPTS